MMRYPRLTDEQLGEWIGSWAIMEYYQSQPGGLDSLREKVQWIYHSVDRDKITIQFCPPDREDECRQGKLGCISCPHQDYWQQEVDADRPPVFGYPQYKLVLYRGLTPTGTVHNYRGRNASGPVEPCDQSKVVHTIIC